MTGERGRPANSGFTLIEVLVTVVVLGLVMISLAAAFTVIVKATPAAEARTNDARALNNLTTWLSKDVSSTAEDGFRVGGTSSSSCTGVPTSTTLLELTWREGTTTYVSNYRYLSTGSNTGTIHRYSCQLGQPAVDLRLTPDLTNVSTGTLAPAPVAITLVPTTMANGNAGNKGLQFVVTVLENGATRELLSLDATTTNVLTTLPPAGGGSGSTNLAPTAPSPLATSIPVGGTVNLATGAFDPNGDTLAMTFSGVPALWNVSANGVVATITPDPLAAPGNYSFSYIVSDPRTATATGTINVTVSAVVTNQSPSAQAATMVATRGVAATVTLNASDPEDGTALTLAVGAVPAGWTKSQSGLQVSITPSATATGTTVIGYMVTDSGGATASSTITVKVCTVSIASIGTPVQVHTRGQNVGELKQDVPVSITTNGACGGALVLAFKPKAADTQETTIAFGTATSITIDKSADAWDTVSRSVDLHVRQGANGLIEATGTLQVNA